MKIIALLYCVITVAAGAAATIELVAEKVGNTVASKFTEKLSAILNRRPCNCQLVMNPPPMPWWHPPGPEMAKAKLGKIEKSKAASEKPKPAKAKDATAPDTTAVTKANDSAST